MTHSKSVAIKAVSEHPSILPSLGFLRALPSSSSIPCTRELLATSDGGNFALDWYHEQMTALDPAKAKDMLKTRPIVLILHGVS